MTVEMILEQYPDIALVFVFAGLLYGPLLRLIPALVDLFDSVLFYRRGVARCLGFHSGTISGCCYNRLCPYNRQCHHYDSRSFIRRWRDRKRKEP